MTEELHSQDHRPTTAIDAIAEAWVETELNLQPEYRAYLGRDGQEGEYSDYSPAGTAAYIAEATKTLAAISSADTVDSVDVVTKMDLSRELQLAIDKYEAGFS